MAWASVGSLGTVNSITADQSSLVLTTSATLEAGNAGVIAIAVDNNQTTDGDEVAVTGVTDSAGNTWLKAAEFTNGQGAAKAGATCSIWYVKAGVELTSGGTITASFSNSASRDAAAASAWEFTIGAGATVTVEGTATLANDGADAGSLNVTTPNAEFLRFRATASEGNQTTAWTNTVGWTDVTQSIADVGAATDSQSIRAEFIISTATGAASDPATFNRDHASVYVAFKEAVVSAYTLPADAGSYALTGAAATLRKTWILTAAAGSYALTGATASLERGFYLAAAVGSYLFTGSAATLIPARAPPNTDLTVADNETITVQTGATIITAQLNQNITVKNTTTPEITVH